MDDDEGYWTAVAVFEPSGAIFSRRCPKCGSFMAYENIFCRQNWLTEMVEGKADCRRCGPVEPVHLGWEGDVKCP